MAVTLSLFGNLAGGHTPLSNYRLMFSKHDFNHYFKFTFVRNPWARLFSAYYFLCNGGQNRHDQKWAQHYIVQYKDFNEFVRHWVSKPDNLFKYSHFIPQSSFVCHPRSGKIDVDFVGFYENLENDFNYIKKRINALGNPTLLKKNTGPNKSDYRQVYDAASREIVAEVYAQDIKAFGYTFDNSSLSQQLANRRAT